jgi:hypothetical protein
VDRIGEVVDTASEGEYARMYGTSFTAGSLARKGNRAATMGKRRYVSSDKELMGVKRMAEGSSRGGEESCE